MSEPAEIAGALALVEAGRREDALALLADLARREDLRIRATGHRAWLLRSMGRLPEAIEEWTWLLELQPGDAEVEALRAEARLRLGDTAGAARGAATALAADPMNTRAFRVLGEVRDVVRREPAPPPHPAHEPGPVTPFSPLNPTIALLESEPVGACASVHPEAGRFLYGLVRLLRPATVVETGSWLGYSALCIAQALEDNGGGHLHAFDLFGERPGWGTSITGPCTDSLAVARAHAEHAGLSHRITFRAGDSSQGIRDTFAGRADAVDFAFVDGDHRARGVLRDWEALDAAMRPGALIVLHDTEPSVCGWYGPRYLMEELAQRHPTRWRAVMIPTAGGAGMGVLQKLGAGVTPSWRPGILDTLRDMAGARSAFGSIAGARGSRGL